MLLTYLKKLGKFFTFGRISLIFVIGSSFWFFVLGDQGLYQLKKLFIMRDEMKLQKANLEADLTRLKREYDYLKKPKNLERVIRTELGFIKPGEVIFQE